MFLGVSLFVFMCYRFLLCLCTVCSLHDAKPTKPSTPMHMWTHDCLSSWDGLGSLSSWQRGCKAALKALLRPSERWPARRSTCAVALWAAPVVQNSPCRCTAPSSRRRACCKGPTQVAGPTPSRARDADGIRVEPGLPEAVGHGLWKVVGSGAY